MKDRTGCRTPKLRRVWSTCVCSLDGKRGGETDARRPIASSVQGWCTATTSEDATMLYRSRVARMKLAIRRQVQTWTPPWVLFVPGVFPLCETGLDVARLGHVLRRSRPHDAMKQAGCVCCGSIDGCTIRVYCCPGRRPSCLPVSPLPILKTRPRTVLQRSRPARAAAGLCAITCTPLTCHVIILSMTDYFMMISSESTAHRGHSMRWPESGPGD